jgi:hypothetical protein
LQKVGIWHFWYSFSKNAKFSDSMTSSPKSGSLKSDPNFSDPSRSGSQF